MYPSTPQHTQLTTLIELPESGAYELGERVQQTRIYGGKYTVCLASALAKGTIGTGSAAGYTVEKSTVTRKRGEQGVLTITWMAGGAGDDDPGVELPPDEWSTSPQDLQRSIELLPRFSTIGPYRAGLVQQAVNGSSVEERYRAYQTLVGRVGGPASTQDDAEAKLLADMLISGKQTYYLAAKTYTWVTHSWFPFEEYLGGWTESPTGPGIAFQPPNLSWLRLADSQNFANGVFSLTRTWLGGPDGHWDSIIYAA
jgi:hypothetical protein